MQINYSNINNAKTLKSLYQIIAAASNTLGMLPEECTLEYFKQVIEQSNTNGIIPVGVRSGYWDILLSFQPLIESARKLIKLPC